MGDVISRPSDEVAGHITPVPGGVGPLTVTMLLVNTLEAAKRIVGGADAGLSSATMPLITRTNRPWFDASWREPTEGRADAVFGDPDGGTNLAVALAFQVVQANDVRLGAGQIRA